MSQLCLAHLDGIRMGGLTTTGEAQVLGARVGLRAASWHGPVLCFSSSACVAVSCLGPLSDKVDLSFVFFPC